MQLCLVRIPYASCTGKAKKLRLDRHHLTRFLLASHRLFPLPAGLWDWVLGKQDSIADLLDVLHKHFIDGPIPLYIKLMFGNWSTYNTE